ncbi:MAG: glycosyl transferase family 2 [Opitutae bacterium]|nr:glycosyl transferase family 2 [Opitutae bacterium]
MTSPDPRVSVILPVRDAEKTLASAIESILGQTEKNLELLLVDDGSTDASPRILKEFAVSDGRIRVFSNANRGIVEALNLGLSEAKSPFLARMDADDVSLPDRLKCQCDFLDANPEVGLVACLVEHWTEDGENRKGYETYVDWINDLVESESIRSRRFVESPFAHPSVVFRKSLPEIFGEYRSGDFPEDYELWLRWLECGVKMKKLDVMLLRWRDHDNRLSRVDPRYSVEAFYKMKLEYLHRWLRDNNRHFPKVKIWGAGRITRNRSKSLSSAGTVVLGFYDVDPKKVGDPRSGLVVQSIEEIPEPGEEFIVVMVAARGARVKVSAFLQDRGYREGVHYVLAA